MEGQTQILVSVYTLLLSLELIFYNTVFVVGTKNQRTMSEFQFLGANLRY